MRKKLKTIFEKAASLIGLEEVLFLLGLVLSTYGVWLLFSAVAFIYAGLILMTTAVVLARRGDV